ncbi:MAG: DUF2782 domain-containing protein [Xanthomonadales bacterium]|nr:DUF2782 domain-containing protein [Xanthomonadales bacterium]NIN60146.1 DUF2782 domain-containing protein [Xanthomonadales bacterium]NIN74293.1 DUF2782 domain-containing protein [Xanthomonadales bacterium]NIO12802.1 DUF2782 domain-containing protein [Xanthomonadales bacterium]NIP12539.1 DUF2782 domain-containing protein [Xanthomonadales bacterium]
MRRRFAGAILSLGLVATAGGQDNGEQAGDPAAPPPLPPKVQGEQFEPTVIIRREEERLVEEYSIQGRVYMVKITPVKGPPYYYLDTDGDGQLELQPGKEALEPVRPAYWKVKEWD